MRLVQTALALALLAGCAPAVTGWQPVESPKKLRVEMVRLDHAVDVAPGASGPSKAELDRLFAFLVQSRAQAGDRVLVETPAPAQAASVLALLRRRGLEVATAPGASLRVRLEQWAVTPPRCPDWSKPPGGDDQNRLPSNFGCATASNLGLMVADPRDLVLGREPGPADAEPSILSQQRYRAGKPTPLSSDNAQRGPSLVINNTTGAQGGGGGGEQ